MPISIISPIKKAEDEAAERVSKAEEKARERVSKAKEQARELKEKKTEQAETEGRGMVGEVRAEVKAKLVKIDEESERKAEAHYKKGEKNIPKAAKIIVQSITS